MKNLEFYGYMPGAIGRVAELHARYYQKNWDFGLFFEARVAIQLSGFLSRFDGAQDGFWTVCPEKRIEGSIAIDGIRAADDGAHLRWFILSSKLRGLGIGEKLLEKAVSFCREKGYGSVYLWTFEGLDAARHLYEKAGFRLLEQFKGSQWGTEVIEQKYVLELSS